MWLVLLHFAWFRAPETTACLPLQILPRRQSQENLNEFLSESYACHMYVHHTPPYNSKRYVKSSVGYTEHGIVDC
jgi:hypothetical protein